MRYLYTTYCPTSHSPIQEYLSSSPRTKRNPIKETLSSSKPNFVRDEKISKAVLFLVERIPYPNIKEECDIGGIIEFFMMEIIESKDII